MKDFVDQELFIGDLVVEGGGSRRAGLHGPYVVVGFSEKMVKVRVNGAHSPYRAPQSLVKLGYT
jgi:hypothetical protein